MQAPCGIEIKVGQVWSRGSTYWDVCPMRIDERLLEVECYKVEMGTILTSMKTQLLNLNQFSGKRGGYKLIKDVEAV